MPHKASQDPMSPQLPTGDATQFRKAEMDRAVELDPKYFTPRERGTALLNRAQLAQNQDSGSSGHGGAGQVKALGSFKKGGMVKKTGMYKLHEGEKVVPKPDAKAPVGSGGRFAAMEQKLAGKVKNPAAVAAKIGMNKYGKGKMQKMAQAGKK